MAERTPGVENWKLLVISLAMGVLVVLLYNFQVNRIRKGSEGTQVILLRTRNDLSAGDRITSRNVRQQLVPKDIADGLGSVIKLKSKEEINRILNESLRSSVETNQFLRHEHFGPDARSSEARLIPEGMETCTLRVEPPLTKENMKIIQPGVRVNIVAEFGDERGTNHYHIVKAVRVRTRTSSSITVEVEPDVALDLEDLTAGRKVKVHAISTEAALPKDAGKINSEVKKFIGTRR